MKMKWMKLSLAAILFGTQIHAWAANECDRYRTSYDQTYCMSKIFLESDKELNSVYKDLRNIIGSPTKQELVKTQRSWITYRDNACQPQSGTINVDCNYRVNKQRVDYLRDRLRECKAGTCRNDMITRPSW